MDEPRRLRPDESQMSGAKSLSLNGICVALAVDECVRSTHTIV